MSIDAAFSQNAGRATNPLILYVIAAGEPLALSTAKGQRREASPFTEGEERGERSERTSWPRVGGHALGSQERVRIVAVNILLSS